MTTYQPGSFGVVDVKGPGGWWIGVGQALAGDSSRYKHAFLILDETGTILEAEPGPHGARLANISEYAGDGLLISDAPVQRWMQRVAPPGDGQGVQSWMQSTEKTLRGVIVDHARALVGTPYSWLDYAAIGLLHLGIPSKALRRYVASSGHAQCAQLVDLAYERAGVHLFTDGRLPGDVAPADLAALAEDWRAVA
jgi:hypothetical protein